MATSKIVFHTNLRFLRERRRHSQEDFSQLLDISRNKLQALESGKTKNPSVLDLIAFSEYFGISIDNLLKTDLPSLSILGMRELEAGNDSYTRGTQLRVLATTVDKDNRENLEFVPIKAKAGYAGGYNDPEYISSLPRFTMPNLPREGTFRMFPTMGTSMLPIPENSLVIGQFVQDWLSLKDGTLCIIILKSVGHDFVFKSVHNRIKTAGVLELHSLNPEFQPYEVQVTDVLEIWKFQQYISDVVPAGDISLQSIAVALKDIKVELGKVPKGIA